MEKKLYIILDDPRISGISQHTLQICKYLQREFVCEIILPKKNSNKLIKKLDKKKIIYKFIQLNKISKNNLINFFLNISKNYKNMSNFMGNTRKEDILVIQGSLQFISNFSIKFIFK